MQLRIGKKNQATVLQVLYEVFRNRNKSSPKDKELHLRLPHGTEQNIIRIIIEVVPSFAH